MAMIGGRDLMMILDPELFENEEQDLKSCSDILEYTEEGYDFERVNQVMSELNARLTPAMIKEIYPELGDTDAENAG